MNSRQLQYAILLSKVGSFSQVAEEMNISQPALSKQILSLEKELGVQLFDRGTNPVTMTLAGEQFILQAQDILDRKSNLLRSMDRFRTGESGSLVIGVSPFRSQHLMPEIIKKVKQKYPGIRVCLHEPVSEDIKKNAAEGKYDFAIVNSPVDESSLDVRPFEKEEIVLAVPNCMLSLLPEQVSKQGGKISLADCSQLPFITVMHNQEMRKYFDRLFSRAGYNPQITMEVTGLTTVWAMVCNGLGAALLPLRVTEDIFSDDKVTLFTIKANRDTRQPVIVSRRGQILSPYAQYAIELLTGK